MAGFSQAGRQRSRGMRHIRRIAAARSRIPGTGSALSVPRATAESCAMEPWKPGSAIPHSVLMRTSNCAAGTSFLRPHSHHRPVHRPDSSASGACSAPSCGPDRPEPERAAQVRAHSPRRCVGPTDHRTTPSPSPPSRAAAVRTVFQDQARACTPERCSRRRAGRGSCREIYRVGYSAK